MRYYLLRNLSFGSDGDFTRSGLIQRYNDELAKDLGNLLNRVVSMVRRYRQGNIPAPGVAGDLERDLQRVALEARLGAETALQNWEIGRAIESIWHLVRRTNQYIEQSEPWRLARQPEQQARLDTVLSAAAESLRLLAIFLTPAMPASCERILGQLGLGPLLNGAWRKEGSWGAVPLRKVEDGPVIFPRFQIEAVHMEEERQAHPLLTSAEASHQDGQPSITLPWIEPESHFPSPV